MTLKKRQILGSFNRFRLLLTRDGSTPLQFAFTLGVGVLLPAAGLIFINFSQLRSLERDKALEATFHREFTEYLAISEKEAAKKAYSMLDETRALYPSPDDSTPEKERKLDLILSKCACFGHLTLFDEKGPVVRSQPKLMNDKYFRKEHDDAAESYTLWFKLEGKSLLEQMRKKGRPLFYSGWGKRDDVDVYSSTVLFPVPGVAKDRVVLGVATFDPNYLKEHLFPQMIEELLAKKSADQGGNALAMVVYPSDAEGYEIKPFAASSGYGHSKPEVSRKLDDPFRGLSLGVKFKGTSIKELGETWIHRNFIILGILSLMIIGGLVLTKHIVSKEMAVAKLKSDFVSNVSHELRTPLALIRLYAETLELGRINTQDKKDQYYRIIRKESERLTALINNILDFSRIEAGRKEYEFRETDIAELVRNTLDSYRYQVEQQGFALEESIEPNLPQVWVDREAIARALVNLVNNALKYSNHEKFLGVKLYKEKSVVKLEVEDHGIGIERRDQSKIFEKFYRAGDPLVHNTKGSGLGLSLVRHISQAHGGEIEVESTPGRGSKFILSLPLGTPNLGQAEGTA